MNINKLIETFNLKIISKGPDDTEIEVVGSSRCGVQLGGFYGYFYEKRIQIIGSTEKALLDTYTKEAYNKSLKTLLSKDIPCLILTSGNTLSDEIITYANQQGKWVLSTPGLTTEFIINETLFLQNELAKSIMIHGVLLDVFGMGVLIKGDSGIGKSVTAIELIRRGHLFIADDVVVVKKISSHLLVGVPDKLTKNLMECRGVGIVNINSLFGKSSIRQQAQIDLIVSLNEWDDTMNYSGIGEDIETTTLMDVALPIINIPVRKGQTIPTSIIEIGALNIRQNQMGYNTAKELLKSMKSMMAQTK